MSAPGNPPRLIDDVDARDPGDDLLRQALCAGRDDLPSERELAGLWGKLVPPVGPAGPGGGHGPGAGPGAGGAGAGSAGGGASAGGAAAGASAGGASAGAFAGKIAGALAALGLASVLVWQATRTPTASAPVTSSLPARAFASSSAPNGAQPGDVAPSSATPAESSSAPVPSAGSAPSLSSNLATSAPSGGPTAGAIASAAAASSAQASGLASASAGAPAPSEYELLERARAALGSNPAEALALTARAAELYPRGGMGQEREIIRIQALAGVGRRAEALAAARAFEATHGDSAYVRRLHQLFPEM